MAIRRRLTFGPADVRAFELIFESLAVYQPGADGERAAAALLDKLAAVGEPKPGGAPNADLELYTIAAGADVVISEGERDLLLKALRKVQWPTFALRHKLAAEQLLLDAERLEVDAAAGA